MICRHVVVVVVVAVELLLNKAHYPVCIWQQPPWCAVLVAVWWFACLSDLESYTSGVKIPNRASHIGQVKRVDVNHLFPEVRTGLHRANIPYFRKKQSFRSIDDNFKRSKPWRRSFSFRKTYKGKLESCRILRQSNIKVGIQLKRSRKTVGNSGEKSLVAFAFPEVGEVSLMHTHFHFWEEMVHTSLACVILTVQHEMSYKESVLHWHSSLKKRNVIE